ncbi:MAG: hypothetical protein A4E63_02155 [Syntrophorhabdus sp. PtaU1.Bin050]|nr:MAG: hypothetical protein A4E63_02155 [Syntrophorhabdus sp. PtaU1.Bin050]
MKTSVIIMLTAGVFFMPIGCATASDYLLQIDKECSTSGAGIEFKCKPEKIEVSLSAENGKWFGRNPASGSVWELSVLKDDKYILILDNPVFFSGKSIIYVIKPNKSFYWTEFAYSEILKMQEGTVRHGRVLEIK